MQARETAEDLFAQARQLLLSGAPDGVEPCLCGIGVADAAYAEALHLRGVAHAVAGRIDAALPLLEQAHALRPDDVELAANLSRALGRAERYAEALRLNDRLLCAGHRSPDRFSDSGLMLLALKRHAEALAFFNLALEADPGLAVAWIAKANVLQIYHNPEEALLCLDRAILLDPGNASYRSLRAVVLSVLARFCEAMHDHGIALALEPASAPLWKNRALTLIRSDNPEEALAAIERANANASADASSLCLQAEALHELKRFEESRRLLEEAMRLAPESHEIAVRYCWLLLSLGEYQVGWRVHERRLLLMLPEQMRHTSLPQWTGRERLHGKRIVVWGEQGYGDVIQHCRFALDLRAMGADVVLEIKPQLVQLCASLPGCQVIALDEPMVPCDFQIPVASLPYALDIDSDCIPHAAGYLRAPGEAVERWSAALAPRRHPLRIGIACSGFIRHNRNLMRSMPLRHFLPLTQYADLFLLQPALYPDDEQFQRAHPEIQRPPIDADSFADTAGLVENLDLVISVDTSIAHLAASIGKETWILLDWVAEWRWMHDIAHSPWYHSVRLFRQPSRGDWTSVIRNLLQALSDRHRAGNRQPMHCSADVAPNRLHRIGNILDDRAHRLGQYRE